MSETKAKPVSHFCSCLKNLIIRKSTAAILLSAVFLLVSLVPLEIGLSSKSISSNGIFSFSRGEAFWPFDNRGPLERSAAFIEYDKYLFANTSAGPVLGEQKSAITPGVWSVLLDPFGSLLNVALASAPPGINQPSGITLYDKFTRQPYCLEIALGRTVSTPGACDPP